MKNATKVMTDNDDDDDFHAYVQIIFLCPTSSCSRQSFSSDVNMLGHKVQAYKAKARHC